MRNVFKLLIGLLALACAGASLAFDFVVFGATPGGIAAAVAASRNGTRTGLVEPSMWIGGMLTGGLSHSDIGVPNVIGGLPLELFERMGVHYSGGTNSSPVACYDFEPHVASATVATMLKEADVHVFTGATLQAVDTETKSGLRRILSITTANGSFTAPLFADGSYNGDLAAMAGADMTWGRESVHQFSESLAGPQPPDRNNRYQFKVPVTNYTTPSGALLPLIQQPPAPVGSADNRTQAYCYRLCMTTNRTNQLPITQPPNPQQWLGRWDLLRNYMAAWVNQTGSVPAIDEVITIRCLPHSKADWNVGSAVNMDVVGYSWGFPNGTIAERDAITTFHEQYTKELLWVLANDPGIPSAIRNTVNEWGFCADEFQDTGGFPPYLYIREGKRLVGATVLNQTDRTHEREWPDCIGFGSYSLDCHQVSQFIGPENLTTHSDSTTTHSENLTTHSDSTTMQVWEEGEMSHGSLPSHFGMPFSAMLPRGAAPKGSSATPSAPTSDPALSGPRINAGANGPSNLIVPVAMSASHVAFAAVRLEPTWMILGEAAGTAAAQLVASGRQAGGFAAVDVTALQDKLRSQGAIVDADAIPAKPVPNQEQCPDM